MISLRRGAYCAIFAGFSFATQDLWLISLRRGTNCGSVGNGAEYNAPQTKFTNRPLHLIHKYVETVIGQLFLILVRH